MPHIDIVFDGPPGHQSGRFVETEDHNGRSISLGYWIHRPDGYWALRIRKDEYPAFPHGLLSPWRIEQLLSAHQEKIMSLYDDIKASMAKGEEDQAKLIAVMQTTLAANQELSNKLSAALAVGDQNALLQIKNQLDADNMAMEAAINMTASNGTGSVDSGTTTTSAGTVDNGGTTSSPGDVTNAGSVDSSTSAGDTVSTTGVFTSDTALGTGTVDSGGSNAGVVSSTVDESRSSTFPASSGFAVSSGGAVDSGGTVANAGTTGI